MVKNILVRLQSGELKHLTASEQGLNMLIVQNLIIILIVNLESGKGIKRMKIPIIEADCKEQRVD